MLLNFKNKLRKYSLKNGLNGYIILIDFSKFFENCNHDIIHNIHKKYIYNDYVIKVIEDYLFIDKGIALGIEIAQREASIIPNTLDHYLENNSFFIERYMDDTFCIVDNYDKSLDILSEYYKLYAILKIKIKTKIIPFGIKFKYCKWIYNINNNGKIVLCPHKDTIYR